MEKDKKEVCIIAVGTVIEGLVKIDTHLRLEGEIKGNVHCSGRIVMAKGSSITGDVVCSDLDIHGKITGDVNVKSLMALAASAVIDGDVLCQELSIERGARLNGNCKMS